jgi:hypothetical protein
MGRRIFIVFCLLILVTGSVLVYADGGFFKPDLNRNEDLYEPEQKALIIFDKPIETLIIQAFYSGNLSNFAWIVPVPAYPRLEEFNSILFEELHYLTQPESIEKISVLDLVGIYARLAGGVNGVTVHEQSSIGIFDTAILSSTDESSLVNWLNNNSYYIPESASQIIGEYVKKNWYFVAIRVNEKNLDIIQKLQEIDPGIVDRYSAVDILTKEIMNSFKEDYNSTKINKILEFEYPLTEEQIEKGYRNAIRIMDQADYNKYKNMYNSGPSFDADFFTGWKGTCRSSGKSGYCVTIRNYEFYFSSTFSNSKSKLADYLGVESDANKVREHLIERIKEDFSSKKDYEQSIIYELSEKGFVASDTYDHSSGKAVQVPLETLYYQDLGYNSNHLDYLETWIRSSIKNELFSSLDMGNLDKGVLPPIKIVFNSNEIIYPFKITSVNPGETEVLLYTLAEYKTQISGFKIEYADWLNINDIPAKDYRIYGSRIDWSYLKQLAGEKEYFLTKHRAEFKTDEISGDIIAEKADNNKEDIMRVFEGGFAAWLISLIIFMAVLYGLVLVISLVPKTILNAIIKEKVSAFYFSWLRWFIYPLIYPLLFFLLVFESIRNLISKVIVFSWSYSPIIAPIILITIIHFFVSGIFYLVKKPVKTKGKKLTLK